MPDLTTPRLLLHALTVEEAEALAVGEPLPGWPFAEEYPMPETRDGVGLLLRHRVEDFGFFLAVRREDALVIGEIGFIAPPAFGAVTIGYAIVPSARRQGYATEAVRALARWALRQPDVEEVRAMTQPDNEASVCTLLRAGFVEQRSTAAGRGFALRGYPGLSATSSPPSES